MITELLMQDRRVALQSPVPQSWLERDDLRTAREREAEEQIEDLLTTLDAAEGKLDWMEHSLSWKITAPLRVARDALRSILARVRGGRGKPKSRPQSAGNM